jgi:hypothetical protein
MKNHKTLLFAGCFALNLLLSLAGQAQTTNICDGCTISSTYTNLTGNVYSFIGTNSSLLTGGNTTFFNQGTVQQTGSGTFLVGGFNQNVYFNNEPGAIYQFATDNVIGNDYPGNSGPVFSNQGLIWKSGGTNYSGIQIAFNNQSGVVKVDSGTLYLSGGGTSSNGVFEVAAGAVLNPTGGNSPTWSGRLTGSGSGTVALTNGSITANPSLTLDFTNNLFQWDGGTLQGVITNSGIVTISSTNSSLLTGGNTTFFNQGTVQQTGSGTFLVGGYNQNVYFNNEPGATYQFATDNVIGNDYPGNSGPVFSNQGLVWKSGGTNYSGIQIAFNNQSGVVKVDSGTLYLSGGGTSSNGVFEVASGAVLDLTGGSGPTWSGKLTGSGSGSVALANGSITGNPNLILDFPPNLFQWDGGTLQGTITNTGLVTLSSTNSSLLTGANTIFYNQATVQQVGSGSFLVGGFNQNVYFNNGPGAIYQFVTDNVIGNDYPGNSGPVFSNQGLVWKSGGTNYSGIQIAFNNQSGVVKVDSGTLYLSGGGTSSNGIFNVASGAVLDLTGGSAPTWAGEMTGSGSGQVWLHSGTLFASPALVIACPPNLFQWNGAILQGVITNTGTVTISGTNVSTLTGFNTTFVNLGTVQQTGSGGSLMGTFNGNVYFNNEPGATYEFTTDSSIAFGNNAYGQTSQSVPFLNQGLVWKSGGTNTAAIGASFNNQGGVVQVDSGALTLYGGGTSSNGVFNVASGAVLDLTGGSAPTWAGEMTGSGSGQVWLHSGTLFASPALVIACPPNLLQWNGAILRGNITNTGTVTISGTNVSTLTGGNTTFVNEGTVIQSSSANPVWGTFAGNVYFFNELGAIYDFTSDSSIGFGNNAYGQGTDSAPFSNFGLVRKSGGTNTSAIYPLFVNNFGGSIEVDSGVLAIEGTEYAQNGGSLTIALGGPNANQCGQLAVGGPAVLNGPLKVVLANGYVPVVGDQFEILSCSYFTGTFSSTNVPAGMTVSYRHNIQSLPEYVYLVVTGTVPAQIQSPQLSGGNFTFNFGTANGQNYTVQQNTNLATTNWTFCTNITGNGSIYQFATPVTNIPRRFFRVVEP